MASVTCGLTADDRDQLRNPTLISRIGLLLPLPFTAAADGGIVALVFSNIYYIGIGGACAVIVGGVVAVGICRRRWSSNKRHTPPPAIAR